MARPNPARSRGPLSVLLAWFVRLRWLAGAGVIVGAALDWTWLRLPVRSQCVLGLGITILLYNACLWFALRRIAHGKRGPQRRSSLQLLAWAQLLLDFVSLMLLVHWTGGHRSPLVTLFVLHMVFASLLLPRRMAYAGAAAAVAILVAGLGMFGDLPAQPREQVFGATQICVFFLVVFLTSRVARDLRREHRRALRQNKRIRSMSRHLRRQQRVMLQHEKMVAMGQMAAGVTHEIANPLASMDSLLQLVQRKPEKLGPDAIEKLREQVKRINTIVQQMKTFAHPAESQQQPVMPLSEVIDRTLEMLRFDRRVRTVKVHKSIAPDAATVAVPAQTLEQVLLNLSINALDAMSDVAEPRLEIRAERRDGHCTIEIIDNGHGIRPEHMQRLFEPFFTTKPVGKGTGLGLSISYSLIQKLGGHITARSEPGRGTTFTIRLPVPAGAAQLDLPPSQNWESPATPIAASGKSGA